MKSEKLIGLDNILKRLAWYYLKLGRGSHKIDHPLYDEVRVIEEYDWYQPPDNKIQPQGGITVSFYKEGKRIRWVDFAIYCTGGGGRPILEEVI